MNLSYLIVDPSSDGPSCSRFGLLIMNIAAFITAFVMLACGGDPSSMITGVAATDASVYALNSAGRFLSRGTAKSFTPTD